MRDVDWMWMIVSVNESHPRSKEGVWISVLPEIQRSWTRSSSSLRPQKKSLALSKLSCQTRRNGIVARSEKKRTVGVVGVLEWLAYRSSGDAWFLQMASTTSVSSLAGQLAWARSFIWHYLKQHWYWTFGSVDVDDVGWCGVPSQASWLQGRPSDRSVSTAGTFSVGLHRIARHFWCWFLE